MVQKYYSSFEVAKICHVSPSSVVRWIREGKLRAANTAGGHHRVSHEDLADFLQTLNMPLPPEFAKPEEPIRVLVVDDEQGIRDMIKWVLAQYFPRAVIEEAQEGFIAGWKAHGLKPHLVILDLMLPGFDGFHVCDFIRSFKELKDCKVIAISALQDVKARERILGLGADCFLVKPFDVELLKKTIVSLLALKEGGAAA